MSNFEDDLLCFLDKYPEDACTTDVACLERIEDLINILSKHNKIEELSDCMKEWYRLYDIVRPEKLTNTGAGLIRCRPYPN